LAVGRGNGDIEIRQVNESWRVAKRICGKTDIPVVALVWHKDRNSSTEKYRLFGGTMDGIVCEIDLAQLRFRSQEDCFGGAVWCMALAASTDSLAVGCEDGTIRMFSLDGNSITYIRTIQTLQQRVLSLVWDEKNQIIFSGGADSTIKLFESKTGRCTARITLEQYSGSPTLVWALALLSSGLVLASGDSLGQVKLWDIKTTTLLQQILTHDADVRCLQSFPGSPELLFASGIDSKVVCLRGPTSADVSYWTMPDSHRPHTHDVFAFAACTTHTGKRLLVSGGVDTKLCVYSVDSFGQNRPKSILPFPFNPIISIATISSTCTSEDGEARLVLVQHPRRLDLWKIAEKSSLTVSNEGSEGPEISKDCPYELWGRIEMGNHFRWNLACAVISPLGDLLAYSSPNGTEVLAVNYLDSSFKKVRKLPRLCKMAAHMLLFSPDGRRLVNATENGDIVISNFEDSAKPVVEHCFETYEPDNPVCALAFSSEGLWLATALTGSSVYLYNMDTFQMHWKLPSFDSPPTALAFHCHNATLVVSLASNKFYLFDVEEQRLSEWSRDCGDSFPIELMKRPDAITGIAFNPAKPNELLLYSHGFFCHVDLKFPVPEQTRFFPKFNRKLSLAPPAQSGHTGSEDSEPKKKKAKKNLNSISSTTKSDGDNFVICLKYKPILFLGFQGKNNMMVFENPWLNIVQKLPGTLYRKRYGT